MKCVKLIETKYRSNTFLTILFRASCQIRTDNPFITSEVHYHCAKEALLMLQKYEIILNYQIILIISF